MPSLYAKVFMGNNNFTIKIADIPIAISAIYAETQKLCDAYRTEEQSVFSVSISEEDIELERRKSRQEALLEGSPVIPWKDDYLETLAVYRKIASGLLAYDRLLFHGSAIAVDGEGYLFTAKSGTGKSTHTRLWREFFGDRAVMVNDDKPILKITENGVFVCGTPWDGKHHLSSNIIVPLKAVCILSRDVENHIEAVSVQEAYPMLLQQSFRPPQAEKLMKTMELVRQLTEKVKLYSLGCNMELEAARVSYEGCNEYNV